MKPVVIFKGKNANGMYEFTEEEFAKICDDTYQDGVRDGRLEQFLWHFNHEHKDQSTEKLPYYGTEPKVTPLPYITNVGPTEKSCADCEWFKNIMSQPGKIYVGDTPCTWCEKYRVTCGTGSMGNTPTMTTDIKTYFNQANAQTPGLNTTNEVKVDK